MKKARILGGFLICLSLSACGQKLAGTYADPAGATKYTFHGNTVDISSMGTVAEFSYTMDGVNIDISPPTEDAQTGDLVLTLNEDGTIQGPGGVKLTKQP